MSATTALASITRRMVSLRVYPYFFAIASSLAAVDGGTRPATRTSRPPGLGGRPIFFGFALDLGAADMMLTLYPLCEGNMLLTSKRAGRKFAPPARL